MASPDLTPYVDLSLYDKDEQEIYDAAILDMSYKVPEWVPKESNTEVVLLESMALEVAEAVFALNRLPGAIVEVLMRMYGIDRYIGAQPTTTITFTISTDAGLELPAGISVQLSLGDGLEPVVFTTTEALVIPAGSITGTVAATGDRFTADANGAAAGTSVDIIDSLIYLESAVLGSPVVDGADAETDEEWRDRAVARFGRLTETLVLPSHFTAAVLEDPTVKRAFTVDAYRPDVAGNPGDFPGYVTVCVLGQTGLLDASAKAAIQQSLDVAAQANLAVYVSDVQITPVDVTATVRYENGYTAAQVQQNVIDALTNYLSPDTWDWSSTVRRNELIALMSNADGVAYVDSLGTPTGDVALPGVAPLADAGTFTITAVAV